MNAAPIIRIILRYGVGYFAGSEVGNMLALDADIVTIIAVGSAACIEGVYALAVSKGWAK